VGDMAKNTAILCRHISKRVAFWSGGFFNLEITIKNLNKMQPKKDFLHFLFVDVIITKGGAFWQGWFLLFSKPCNHNGTARFKKCKQFFKYKHLLLLRDIWWSKFKSILKCCSFFKHQS
jgi:hypothetical protein